MKDEGYKNTEKLIAVKGALNSAGTEVRRLIADLRRAGFIGANVRAKGFDRYTVLTVNTLSDHVGQGKFAQKGQLTEIKDKKIKNTPP